MKRITYKRTTITPVKTYEGEPIELKVERLLTNKEGITDGAPIIYTERKDGVNPAHNIRTDRWEIAAQTMDVVHRNKAAKSEAKGVEKGVKKEEDTKTTTKKTNSSNSGGTE